MEEMDWEPEDYSDYPEELDEEGFGLGDLLVPGLSPSVAAARRLLGSRGRKRPTRPRPVPMGPAKPGAQGMIRQVEQKVQAKTDQLAVQQSRLAARQSSDTFGPALTAAAAAFTVAAKDEGARGVLNAALTHGLPMLQLLTTSRGRAISAGFSANPVATLAFPAAALIVGLLRDRMPGFKQLDPPEFTMLPDPQNLGSFYVTVTRWPSGCKVKLSAPAPQPGEPDQEYAGTFRLDKGHKVKLQVVNGTQRSEVLTVGAPN